MTCFVYKKFSRKTFFHEIDWELFLFFERKTA
jgi:hypothetical protein